MYNKVIAVSDLRKFTFNKILTNPKRLHKQLGMVQFVQHNMVQYAYSF